MDSDIEVENVLSKFENSRFAITSVFYYNPRYFVHEDLKIVYLYTRSSFIYFACIGVALTRRFMPQEKGDVAWIMNSREGETPMQAKWSYLI